MGNNAGGGSRGGGSGGGLGSSQSLAQWNHAKSTQELEQQAALKFGVNVDFQDMNIETIRESMKELEILSQEFPQITRRLKFIGHSDKVIGAIAGASKDGKSLYFNKNFYGEHNQQKFIDKLEYQTKNRRKHFVDNTIKGVIDHEFGHLIDSYYKSEKGTKSEIWNKWRGRYTEELQRDAVRYRLWWRQQQRKPDRTPPPKFDLSFDGAFSGSSAFVAETFTQLKMKGKVSKYSQQLHDILQTFKQPNQQQLQQLQQEIEHW